MASSTPSMDVVGFVPDVREITALCRFSVAHSAIISSGLAKLREG
jgi:hypothetical protein